MKTIVTLANGSKDLVILSKNNPESGAIMLRSNTMGVNETGFMQVEKRVGLFKGNVADLRKLIADNNIVEGTDFSAILPVRIVIEESTTPFYEGQQPKLYPANHPTKAGQIVTSGGKAVYRQQIVVAENSTKQDVKCITDVEPVVANKISANVEFSKRGN